MACYNLESFTHKLLNVLYKKATNNACATKRNGNPIRPCIGNSKGVHCRVHDGLIRRVSVANRWARRDQVTQLFIFGVTAKTDKGDKLEEVAGNVGLCHSGCSDFIGEIVELVEKNIVEDSEADSATNISNGQCYSGNSADEVGRADNLSNQGARDDDSTDANTGQCNDGIHGRGNVVGASGRHGADECGHEDTPEHHEPADAALQYENETEIDASSADDTETNWKSADANPDRVVTVDVEHLGRPEEEHDEEVASADECDEQDRYHGGLAARKDTGRNHGMRGKLDFVDAKDGNEGATQEEGSKNIGAGPFVLLE